MISRASNTARLGGLWLLLGALGLLSLASAQAADTLPPYNPEVRIELAHFFAGASHVIVSCDMAFTAKDSQGRALASGNAGGQVDLTVGKNGLVALSRNRSSADSEASQAGEDDVSNGATEVAISPEGNSGVLSIALPGHPLRWRHYRGAVSVSVAGGGLRIINDIPMEEYLCGVLKPEIGASAPAEALKTQAIAARTYAVRNLGHLASEGADLDDTTRTQSYLGVDGETPSIRSAVNSTAGMVMTYQGQPIEALYSTDCGGETAQGGPGEPYLQPVSDPDCAAKPAWTKTYTRQQLQEALQKSSQTSVEQLVSLTVESTDPSGRASIVAISGGNEEIKDVTGAQLRLALGTDELRSTLFTLKQASDGSFVFTGHGWGHGLGMCQEGAVALAQGANPEPCDKILKHYYTGIEIVPLTPALVAAVTSHSGKLPAHEISSSAVSSGGKS